MHKIGLENELIEIIRRMKWETLFFMNLDVYEDLVYEFYSSLSVSMDKNDNMVRYTISFRMKGKDFDIEPKKFVVWLIVIVKEF